jgi:hypothetical protein
LLRDTNKNRRFEIIESKSGDDSYMSSHTSHQWVVRSLEAGDELMSFGGTWDEDSDGTSKRGAASVSFSSDSMEIIVRDFDGSSARHELPARISIVEEGQCIELEFPDGRKEKRQRRRAGFLELKEYRLLTRAEEHEKWARESVAQGLGLQFMIEGITAPELRALAKELERTGHPEAAKDVRKRLRPPAARKAEPVVKPARRRESDRK